MRDEGKNQNTLRRLRQLAYYIPADRFCRLDEIMILSPRIAAEYWELNPVTLRRDLDLLTGEELLTANKSRYRANHELLYGIARNKCPH